MDYQDSVIQALTRIAAEAELPVTLEYRYSNSGRIRAGELGNTVAYLDFTFQSPGKSTFLINGAQLGHRGTGPRLSFLFDSLSDSDMKEMLESWRQLTSAGATAHASTEGARLIAQLRETVEAIKKHPFPRLEAESITDDGETYMGLRCPACRVDVNGAELLGLVQICIRTVNADALEDTEIIDGAEPLFDFGDDPEFENLHYRCGDCGAGFRLAE